VKFRLTKSELGAASETWTVVATTSASVEALDATLAHHLGDPLEFTGSPSPSLSSAWTSGEQYVSRSAYICSISFSKYSSPVREARPAEQS
jgi:hypothetical protein